MKNQEYDFIIVESYYPSNTNGLHGPVHVRPVHVRPVPNQEPYETTMHVECSKDLSYDYPVGTQFRIKAKISQREKERNSFIAITVGHMRF